MKAGSGPGRASTAWYVVTSDRYLARWWNALHVPYTLWHLSYLVMGAALGTALRWDVLGWAVLAFFLGLGIAGHAFDLLRGDPLALKLPASHLEVAGVMSLLLAAFIGSLNIYWGNVPWWLGWAIVAGILMALGYNLEWPGLHGDLQFALFWGAFPFLVGNLAMGGGLDPAAVMAGAFCFLTAWSQRVLSARARYLRRKVARASLTLDEKAESATAVVGQPVAWMLRPMETTLLLLTIAMPVLAIALMASRR